MPPVPNEFDPGHIALKSEESMQMYRSELAAKDPMRSVLADNPEIYFVPPKRRQEWGQWEYQTGAYYDTTRGSMHPDWQGQDLPRPSKDIARLRSDFIRWGYCMIEEALSESQVSLVLTRVLEQAEGDLAQQRCGGEPRREKFQGGRARDPGESPHHPPRILPPRNEPQSRAPTRMSRKHFHFPHCLGHSREPPRVVQCARRSPHCPFASRRLTLRSMRPA